MRKYLLTSVSLTAIGLASVAVGARDAQAFGEGHNWYVSLFGGVTSGNAIESSYYYVYDTELETGFTVGGAVGTELFPGLRGEFEFSFQSIDNDETQPFAAPPLDLDGSYEILYLFTNLWKDFDLGFVSPYFGGGVGIGIADVESTCICGVRFDEQGIGFASQLGVGFRFLVTEQVSLDVGYRFRALVDVGLESDANSISALPSVANVFTHTGQIGVTYEFGDQLHTLSAANSDGLDSLWYVSVFGGVSIPEDTAEDYYNYTYIDRADTGFTVGGAIGTYVAPELRGELEIAYARHAYDDYLPPFGGIPGLPASGDQTQITFLANLWKEFPMGDFAPYIGGGVGIGLNVWDDVVFVGSPGISISDSGVGLASQFGAGVRYAVTENVAFDISYRFRSIINTMHTDSIAGNTRISTYSHNVQAGITYGFGSGTILPAADTNPDSEDSFYMSIFGGLALPEESAFTGGGYVYDMSFDDGFTIGLTAGTEIARGVRGELEVSYLSTDVDEVDTGAFLPPVPGEGGVEQFFLLTNLWKDFELGMGLSPYVGGGVGLAIVDFDARPAGAPAGTDDTKVAPAAQLGAGLRFQVVDDVTLDFGYRFKAVLNAPYEGSALTGFPHVQQSFYNHVFQAGAAFGF